MKKIYVKPAIKVTNVASDTILAGSEPYATFRNGRKSGNQIKIYDDEEDGVY